MAGAIDLIESRLTEDVRIEKVAARAYCSPFHFQRAFHMITGFTVGEYIRQRRLTLAAHDLLTSPLSVLEIALKYRYESPEAFARAFRRIHGLSPSEARRADAHLKAFPRVVFHLSLKGDEGMEYRIVERPAFTVSGKAIRTTDRNGENFRVIPQFWEESYQDGTVAVFRAARPDGAMMGICIDRDQEAEEFSYVIGVEGTVAQTVEGMRHWTIPASTWAVFPSHGALPDAIQGVWRRIFEECFPSTGYQHSGGPEIELLPPGDDRLPDYRSEVWVPVVKG